MLQRLYVLSVLACGLAITTAHANNHLINPALQKMQGDWTWANFAALPNTDKRPTKDPNSKNRYMMTHTIKDDNPYIGITFYGTKERPDVAVVESRVWGGSDDYPHFVRLDKLKGLSKLASNCNLKDVSYELAEKDDEGFEYTLGGHLEFQQVYRYPITSKKTLYMSSMKATSIVITSTFQSQHYTLSLITPYKDKLGVFINAYAWSVNNQGDTKKCTVSEPHPKS